MILFGISGSYIFLSDLGKCIIKIGKISIKIHEIGKLKAVFGFGMTRIHCGKNGQIKSLDMYHGLSQVYCIKPEGITH